MDVSAEIRSARKKSRDKVRSYPDDDGIVEEDEELEDAGIATGADMDGVVDGEDGPVAGSSANLSSSTGTQSNNGKSLAIINFLWCR